MGLFNRFRNTNIDFPEEVLSEIKEALHFLVCSGYYGKDEIFDRAEEIIGDICMVHDMDLPEPAVRKKIIDKIQLVVGKQTENGENYGRLRHVFDILNYEHIIAIDFAGYSMDDGFEEVENVLHFMQTKNIPCKGYCFCHQQDIERAMDKTIQNLYLAFHSVDNEEKKTERVGERITEMLRAAGFHVNWSHDVNSRICIEDFEWDKAYDGESYGAERAAQIMKFHTDKKTSVRM